MTQPVFKLGTSLVQWYFISLLHPVRI